MYLTNKNNSGSVTISFIMVLCLVSLFGALLSRVISTEVGTVVNFSEGISAQYVAEAGLRRGLVVLIGNGNPHGLSEDILIEGNSVKYSIAVSTEGNNTRIRSTGISGNARRTISAEISKAGRFALPDYAVVSTGALEILGDIMVRGPIIAGGPTEIHGAAMPLLETQEKIRCVLPNLSMPPAYRVISAANNNGTIALDGQTIVFAEPQIVLDGATSHLKGPGVLWVRGDVIVRGATVDEGAVIISEGNIRIESRSRLVGALIAAPKGSIDVTGDGIYISGSIWAKDHIDLVGSGSLISSEPDALKAAMDRLGLSNAMRQPYVIHSWGI